MTAEERAAKEREFAQREQALDSREDQLQQKKDTAVCKIMFRSLKVSNQTRNEKGTLVRFY